MLSANSRIGVVGASGFIGRALVEHLVAEGQDCPRLFGRRVGQVGRCTIELLDLKSESFCGLDCIVHLSGITSSRMLEENLRRVNVDLAAGVASAAAAAGVKRIVFVSSLHVHGKAASGRISPDSPPDPDNAYGRSKAEAEAALRRIAGQTGMEIVILRPPMVYGAGGKGSFRLLARLIRTGLPLPFALARSRRSFCSVGNLVSAIRHAIEAPAPPAVLIPADPEDFDTPELVRTMAAAMGRRVRLWPIPKTLLAVPLAVLGRAEMITSLFEPLQVDRTHWHEQGWRPVESGAGAVRAALGRAAAAPMLLYVTNSTPYFFSHRIAFAREAARRGFRIALAGGDVVQHRDLLDAEGILPLPIPGGARGVDPVGDLRAGLAIAAYIRQLDIQVVHASGLKTMFLCALARLGGPLPRAICIVTGLGSTYINDTPKTRMMRHGIEAVLRPLLRRPRTMAVFQNSDDRAYFLKRRVVRAENTLIIKGSGVDTSEYAQAPEPTDGPPLVVFPARLLKSKGVREFAEAAAILTARGVTARFALVGDLDPANPDALTPTELAGLVAGGAVEAWGFRNDMAAVLAGSHLVCLPSYREGVPKALIEAASIGRAIVTTDVPGCREIVCHDENGLLVPARDARALAEALEKLIGDPARRRRMGLAGRALVEKEFSMEAVIGATVDLYGQPTYGAPQDA